MNIDLYITDNSIFEIRDTRLRSKPANLIKFIHSPFRMESDFSMSFFDISRYSEAQTFQFFETLQKMFIHLKRQEIT